MALKSTIHRLELDVADIDHGNYGSFPLTLARHPSETEERLMMRVLAFALHADPALEFGRGISSEDEPDLWLKDATGAITLWIDVGLPDERRLRRAAGRAGRIVVIAYGGRGVDVWWDRIREALARLPALTVLAIPFEAGREMAAFVDRSMRLQCTVQEQQVYLNDAARSMLIEPVVLRAQQDTVMYARAHAERHPDQPCVIMGGSGETPSYGQLETRAAGGRARSASPDGSMSTVGDAGYLDADGFDRQSRLV